MIARHLSPLALIVVAIATPIRGVVGQAQPSADSIAVRVAAGKALFHGKGLCFSCHGKDGDGSLGPSTKLAASRPLVHIKPVLAEVIGLIKSGVDSAHSTLGQPMPARGGSRLTDTEVESVAWYVLYLQKKTPPV